MRLAWIAEGSAVACTRSFYHLLRPEVHKMVLGAASPLLQDALAKQATLTSTGSSSVGQCWCLTSPPPWLQGVNAFRGCSDVRMNHENAVVSNHETARLPYLHSQLRSCLCTHRFEDVSNLLSVVERREGEML
jgi:hypothetical protein